MRLSIKAWTRLAAGTLAVLAMALAVAPAAKATTQRGCPTGAFCIYPRKAGWNHNHPSNIMRPDRARYLDHQVWNLSHQIGIHRVFNNGIIPGWDLWQYVDLNRGYNGAGRGACGGVGAGRSYDIDLTPVNSITIAWEELTHTA